MSIRGFAKSLPTQPHHFAVVLRDLDNGGAQYHQTGVHVQGLLGPWRLREGDDVFVCGIYGWNWMMYRVLDPVKFLRVME